MDNNKGCVGTSFVSCISDCNPPRSWILGNSIRNIDICIVMECLEDRPNRKLISRLKSDKAKMIIEYKYERSKELI